MDLAGLLGNGAGLLCLGIGIILMKQKKLQAGKTGAVVMRIVIVLMFIGGAGLIGAGIGTWIQRGANAVLSLFGAAGLIIAALAAFAMLLTVVLGLWKEPNNKVAWTAAMLPFALALVTGGVLGQIGDTTQRFANDGSAQVSSFLTGR